MAVFEAMANESGPVRNEFCGGRWNAPEPCSPAGQYPEIKALPASAKCAEQFTNEMAGRIRAVFTTRCDVDDYNNHYHGEGGEYPNARHYDIDC
ncbi:hypothetical protein sS8_1060 [Methylocaldum marinum]|uniref:Uncharacterized protein n=1 Tax=Methylocaldum marinum TaxID=1432792 RepID=A0A250KMV4_9GAMM|nr:hypothetical protein sS8_0897 [Methylocaldum marinum]BBA33022.1 hypothetical protein sS8_1060 [Methylocaldum marinum]